MTIDASEPYPISTLRQYLREELFGSLASLPYIESLKPRERRFYLYYIARDRRQVMQPIAPLEATVTVTSRHLSNVLRVLRAVIVTTQKQGELLVESRPELGDALLSAGNLLFERESRLLRIAIATRLREQAPEEAEGAVDE